MFNFEPSMPEMPIDVLKSSHPNITKSPSLRRNNRRHRLNQRVIERRTHQNRLRETRSIAVVSSIVEVDTRRVCNTVETLRPPCIRGKTETGHAWSLRAHVAQLLCRCEGIDEGCGAGERVGGGVAHGVVCQEPIDAVGVSTRDCRNERRSESSESKEGSHHCEGSMISDGNLPQHGTTRVL